MAYDEELADGIRALLAGRDDVAEKRMFGGLAFLVRGNMAVAARGRGGLLVRVDPADGERLVAAGAAETMVMRGRPLRGWLRVDGVSAAALAEWVERGVTYAGSLPAK